MKQESKQAIVKRSLEMRLRLLTEEIEKVDHLVSEFFECNDDYSALRYMGYSQAKNEEKMYLSSLLKVITE